MGPIDFNFITLKINYCISSNSGVLYKRQHQTGMIFLAEESIAESPPRHPPDSA
jgi:hypothetical protein